MFTIDKIIVWIVIGLLGGTLASRLITWDRSGFGIWRNMGLGLAGALVGGALFRLLGLLPDLDKISVSLRDVVSSVVGALIVLAGFWLWSRSKTGPTSSTRH